MAGGADRPATDRRTPLMMRAGGTPYAHRAQPDQIYRDRSSFPADRRQISSPTKTAPYGWIDGYLRRICNRDCRPGSLPLLGLGLPDLINRLQRREILHQDPVSEDVTTTDLAQKDAFGRII
jgi:hypothetical protein